MHGAMSLVLLWMLNGSLHHFSEKYNYNLGVGHRLQFVGSQNVNAFRVFSFCTIAARYCKWIALPWVTWIITKASQ